MRSQGLSNRQDRRSPDLAKRVWRGETRKTRGSVHAVLSGILVNATPVSGEFEWGLR